MSEFELCVTQLEMLLEAENAALTCMDVAAVTALASEKRQLVSRLRELRDALAGQDAPAELAVQVRRLSRLCGENRALLERAMLVQRRLMDVVIAATKPAVTGYGRKGAALTGPASQARAIVAQA